MIRISFLFFALLASATGVPDDNMSIPAIIVADNAFGAIAGGDVNKVTGCTHYEHPPCGSDEKAVQVMGVDGVFCSPMCTPDGVCPHDVPKGVIAVSYSNRTAFDLSDGVRESSAVDCQ